MRLVRFAAIVAALLTLSAALGGAPAAAEGVPGFTPTDLPLIEQRGLPMSAQEAMERITFHPFVPTPHYLEVALLPALHGDDKENPQNRGIGYEYASAGQIYILREWPLAGASFNRYPSIPGAGTCTTGHLTEGTPQHIRALAWSTPTLGFALQPDIPQGGNPNLRALRTEWARLVKRGACR
ncbi:MAG TPA: hypothetical protein VIJ64_10345 [Candidatus Lustribacter sp.]